MCKSPNRELGGLPLLSAMLIPSELPNWLLFRTLTGKGHRKPDRSKHLFR